MKKIQCAKRTKKMTTRSRRKVKKKVRKRRKTRTSMCSRAPREIANPPRAREEISDIEIYKHRNLEERKSNKLMSRIK